MNLQLMFYRTDQADSYDNAIDTGAMYCVRVTDIGIPISRPNFTNTSTVRDALNTIITVADCFDGGFALAVFLVELETNRLLDAITYLNGKRR